MLLFQNKQRCGRRLHVEHVLPLGAPAYVLGTALVDREAGDRLEIRAGSENGNDDPFLISGFAEQDILHRGGSKAIMIMLIAYSAALLAVLMILGAWGSFNPGSYFVGGMTGPVLMVALLIVMHYNDIVALKQRALRDLSNIDVALRKRNDLIPRLQDVVRDVLRHEQEVQQGLAELRSLSGDRATENLAEAHRRIEQIGVLIEATPELNSNQNIRAFFDRLVSCENEIAFISRGYNDAVEVYNSRIATLPDLILAKIGKFETMEFLTPPDGSNA